MKKTYDLDMVIAIADINQVFDIDESAALRAVYAIKRFMGIS